MHDYPIRTARQGPTARSGTVLVPCSAWIDSDWFTSWHDDERRDGRTSQRRISSYARLGLQHTDSSSLDRPHGQGNAGLTKLSDAPFPHEDTAARPRSSCIGISWLYLWPIVETGGNPASAINAGRPGGRPLSGQTRPDRLRIEDHTSRFSKQCAVFVAILLSTMPARMYKPQ